MYVNGVIALNIWVNHLYRASVAIKIRRGEGYDSAYKRHLGTEVDSTWLVIRLFYRLVGSNPTDGSIIGGGVCKYSLAILTFLKLLNMFNSKGTTSVDLSKKVDSVLNAFKTAIDGLNTVNTQAKAGIAAKEEEIKAAQTEKEALEAICKKNESVLAKLTAILE